MPGWKSYEEMLEAADDFWLPQAEKNYMEIDNRGFFKELEMAGFFKKKAELSKKMKNFTVQYPIKPAEITYERLKKQILFDLLTNPKAIISATLGASGLLAGFALSSPLIVFSSIAAIVGGSMIALHKLTNFSKYIDQALAKMKADKKQYYLDYLDALKLALSASATPLKNAAKLSVQELLEAARGKVKIPEVHRFTLEEVVGSIGRLHIAYDEFTTQVSQGKIKGNDDLIKGADQVVEQVIVFTDKFLKIKNGEGANEYRRLVSAEITDAVERFEALLKSEEEVIQNETNILDSTLSKLEENIEVSRRVEEQMKDMGIFQEKEKG
jgi:hypothetical protein